MDMADLLLYEKGIRQKFTKEMPVLIRFDGKDVTKDKARWDLTDRGGFTYAVYHAAAAAGRKYDPEVHVFAILDEATLIFSNTEALLSYFDDGDVTYISGILLQEFLHALTKYRATQDNPPMFGLTAVSVTQEYVSSYIQHRKHLAADACRIYYAKQVLGPDFKVDGSMPAGHILEENGLAKGYERRAAWMEEGFDSEKRETV